MSYYAQQNPPQQNRCHIFPNNGPPIFSTGPNPVFPANAAPPSRLHSTQASQVQQSQTPIAAQNQTGGAFRSKNGLFDGTNWKCNCNPRKIAAKFQVKKESPNKGRWFYKCGNAMGTEGETKCSLFLWEDEEVLRRQTHAEVDPSGPMNTANAFAPAPVLQQPDIQPPQPPYQLSANQTFNSNNMPSSKFPQGSISTSGLRTPATTPSKRQTSGPSNIKTAYHAPSPYSSPFHSPPGSPTTFSQRAQPPRPAKSPSAKFVEFDTASECTSEEEEEEDSDTTTDSEDESYETESWEDDIPNAQPPNEPASTHSYDSDDSTDSDEYSEDEYEVETQLNRDIFQSSKTIPVASSSKPPQPTTRTPIQSKFDDPITSTTRTTQSLAHLYPDDTSDSEEDLFITPRSSVEPSSQDKGKGASTGISSKTNIVKPITTAETTTTRTITGPYTTIYHHPPPPKMAPLTPPSTHRPNHGTTPTYKTSTPNPALTTSPMPEKGKLTSEIISLLSSHSITLPGACKLQLESVLERQYRRESASLKAKERLRLIILEREAEIEGLRQQLNDAELTVNGDLLPIFTKSCSFTEKKTDRTYYRRRSELEK